MTSKSPVYRSICGKDFGLGKTNPLFEGLDVALIQDFDNFGVLHLRDKGDYVIDPTGTVDSGLAIKNALIAMTTAYDGCKIVLPPGTFLIEEVIHMRSNVWLEGSGMGITTLY